MLQDLNVANSIDATNRILWIHCQFVWFSDSSPMNLIQPGHQEMAVSEQQNHYWTFFDGTTWVEDCLHSAVDWKARFGV
jgi:hypothetical protein